MHVWVEFYIWPVYPGLDEVATVGVKRADHFVSRDFNSSCFPFLPAVHSPPPALYSMPRRGDESNASSIPYKKQVRGWLSYAFARQVDSACVMGSFLTWSVTSEVFVVVSLTLFLPICLEQFARDNGYYEPDHKTRCASAVITAEEARCVVKIGWAWIDTASFRCASRYPTLRRAH